VSKWFEYKLRWKTKQVPTYLRDSQETVDSLKAMGALPAHARLFTSDATDMYTNIEPTVGIAAVKAWLSEYESELPKVFPSRIVIEALELVMTRNTFQFHDTFWQHFIGTTMGTPCTCVYANVAYGYHERKHITSRLSKQVLPYLKRSIDTMRGIWCGTDKEWELFKASCDGFCKLKWFTSDRAPQLTFMDLTITIDPSSHNITTKTYQKPQNLHLCIPSTSAHPEACFQGTIMGNVIRYWKQNSSSQDFGKLLKQFAERLSRRGHAVKEVMYGIEKVTKYVDAPCFCTGNIIQRTQHFKPYEPSTMRRSQV
jgi:hypothetical protein